MRDWLEIGTDGREIGRDPRKLGADGLEKIGIKRVPLAKAIRAKCLDCCVGSAPEVRACTARTCPLWPYRMGRNPFRVGKLTDAQRKASGDRLRALRARPA